MESSRSRRQSKESHGIAAMIVETALKAKTLLPGTEAPERARAGVALAIVPTTTGTARAAPRAMVFVGRCFAGNIAQRTITGGATGVTTCGVETGNIEENTRTGEGAKGESARERI